jgi:hypothetical protein
MCDKSISGEGGGQGRFNASKCVLQRKHKDTPCIPVRNNFSGLVSLSFVFIHFLPP